MSYGELNKCFSELKEGSKVLDVGCFGFQVFNACNRMQKSVIHYGVDYCSPETSLIPPGFTFNKVDLNIEKLPHTNDFFDLIIATHIIEHLKDPISFFSELVRVCKPGGKIYIEAPSERSIIIPGNPFQYDRFFSTSYFDDPTHMQRVWTPQSFYRLSKYFSCDVLSVGRIKSWKMRLAFPILLPYALLTKNGKLLQSIIWGTVGWAAFVVVQKPSDKAGEPIFYYYIPKQ